MPREWFDEASPLAAFGRSPHLHSPGGYADALASAPLLRCAQESRRRRSAGQRSPLRLASLRSASAGPETLAGARSPPSASGLWPCARVGGLIRYRSGGACAAARSTRENSQVKRSVCGQGSPHHTESCSPRVRGCGMWFRGVPRNVRVKVSAAYDPEMKKTNARRVSGHAVGVPTAANRRGRCAGDERRLRRALQYRIHLVYI